MQLLCTFTANERSDYEARAEDRQQAGLTQLQLWSEADAPGVLHVLFAVNDRARAQSWIDTARATLGLSSAVFLKPVTS